MPGPQPTRRVGPHQRGGGRQVTWLVTHAFLRVLRSRGALLQDAAGALAAALAQLERPGGAGGARGAGEGGGAAAGHGCAQQGPGVPLAPAQRLTRDDLGALRAVARAAFDEDVQSIRF